MAASAEDLRQELAEHRERISMTVDRIEDRVVPGRVVARGRQRLRDRYVDLRDRVMGHDPDDARWSSDWARRGGSTYATAYGAPGTVRPPGGEDDGGLVDQGRELVGQAVHRVGEAPQLVRRKTQGAPLAAGLVAFAAGLVAGGMAPATRREREMADRLDPMVGRAVGEARDAAREVAGDLREPVRDAVDDVKEAARSGAEEVADTARSGSTG